MKKTLILIIITFLLVGCTPIQKMEVNEIVDELTKVDNNLYNEIRTGYKFYVPSGLKNIQSKEFNEIVTDNYHNYYIYIDAVSYFNKVNKNYEINKKAYYSNSLIKGDKFGYVEINQFKSGEYLLEIMYNYAKIEVIVEEASLKKVVAYSINILSSINYNDNVIENMMGNNVLQFKETEFDIFETRRNDENYLNYEETESVVEDVIPDMDLID